MPVADKLGPGQLTLGETGTEQEWGTQVTAVTLEPQDEDGEAVPVLSGDEVMQDGTESYQITGTVFQQFSMTGLAVWSKENHGKIVPFTFVPSTEGELQVTGNVRVKRIGIGGDVKTRNTSEFTFPGVGDYTFAAYTGV